MTTDFSHTLFLHSLVSPWIIVAGQELQCTTECVCVQGQSFALVVELYCQSVTPIMGLHSQLLGSVPPVCTQKYTHLLTHSGIDTLCHFTVPLSSSPSLVALASILALAHSNAPWALLTFFSLLHFQSSLFLRLPLAVPFAFCFSFSGLILSLCHYSSPCFNFKASLGWIPYPCSAWDCADVCVYVGVHRRIYIYSICMSAGCDGSEPEAWHPLSPRLSSCAQNFSTVLPMSLFSLSSLCHRRSSCTSGRALIYNTQTHTHSAHEGSTCINSANIIDSIIQLQDN